MSISAILSLVAIVVFCHTYIYTHYQSLNTSSITVDSHSFQPNDSYKISDLKSINKQYRALNEKLEHSLNLTQNDLSIQQKRNEEYNNIVEKLTKLNAQHKNKHNELTQKTEQINQLKHELNILKTTNSNINFRQFGNGLIFGPIFWNNLPNQTQEQFLHYFPMNAIVNIDETWNGELNLHNVAPLFHNYISIIPQTKQIVWHSQGIKLMIECVKLKYNCPMISNLSNYKNAALQLYSIFDNINILFQSNNVLIGGSISPWVESIILGLNISKYVTTTDYQLPITDYKYINTVNIMDIKNNNKNNKYKYNIIVSYSSIEHDGLGRYGDPLNPFGDFAALQEFYQMLDCNNENSYLILNVPFGSNGILYFNQHRQYGKLRIEQLINQTRFEFIGYTLQDRPKKYIMFEKYVSLSEKVEYFVNDYKKVNHRTRGDNTLVLKPICN